ncbi:hypothetical protein GCM10009689_02080 [Brevibacterium antiquum]
MSDRTATWPVASTLRNPPCRQAVQTSCADKLIAEHLSVAVRMTEMFAVLMRDAFGARYDRR